MVKMMSIMSDEECDVDIGNDNMRIARMSMSVEH